jgi:hypothetical protein
MTAIISRFITSRSTGSARKGARLPVNSLLGIQEDSMTGRADIKLPLPSIGDPSSSNGYLTIANNLLPGIELLSLKPNECSFSCALLAAHATECILKSILVHYGMTEDKLVAPMLRQSGVIVDKG